MNNISGEYAISLFTLGKEKGTLSEYIHDLEIVKNAIENESEYLFLLHSPALSIPERLELIDKAFDSLKTEEILSFLKLLCEKGHILLLPQCITCFFDLVKDSENKMPVTVFFAEEMTQEQKDRLAKKLSEKTGKTLEICYKQDSSLIGGIRVQMEDYILDGSISGRLNTIKGALEK